MMDEKFSNVRVFDPLFTFERAARAMSAASYKELYLILGGISSRREDGGAVPNAPFYRYASHVAVLTEMGGRLYCCTYVDEKPHKVYDLQAEREEVRAFFEAAQGDLTVLDNMHYSELLPRFDVLERFADGLAAAKAAFEERRRVIDDYAAQVKQLGEECSPADVDDPCCLYQRSMQMMERNLRIMNAVSKDIRDVHESELLACYRPLEDPDVNLFGLYVYAMWYALSKERFSRYRVRVMSALYRDVMQEMHAFMKEHEGIADRYCDAMGFPACERETLIAALEAEGLYGDKWIRIGDDCFG